MDGANNRETNDYAFWLGQSSDINFWESRMQFHTMRIRKLLAPLPDKGVQNPYFISFFGIIALLAGYHQKQGHNEQIDFIFDIQHGQVEIVTAAWRHFTEVAPPNLRPLIGDYPIFRSDKTTLPLQAADLGVGWSRQLAEDHYYDRANRTSPWGIEVDIQVIGRYWTKEMLIDLLSTLNLGGGSGMKLRSTWFLITAPASLSRTRRRPS